MRLGTLSGQPQAQIDGFKFRQLSTERPSAQRHLYTTEWRQIEATGCASAVVLVISDDERVQCKRLSLCVSHDQLVTALRNVEWAAIAVAVATQQGCLSVLPLFALEVALTLVQTQMTMSATSKVWLITSGSRGHAGSWGLARSAKAETSLPLVSMSLYTRTLPMALRLGPALTEPEVALHERNSYGPRLKLAPPSVDGLVRLRLPGLTSFCDRPGVCLGVSACRCPA